MANRTRVYTESFSDELQAGIINKIHLENFMCHSSLEIEFGNWVNFITGQNGSGKSAILTALCVAFGSRARGTQRANTMKDFIKTGCSYALVQVEINNQGPDAFKPDVYGNIIVVERRISESTSSITLKNQQGKRVGTKREDLREVIEHFNIDVENPCVIMSQDKSREFLHSGSAKDKFKFFYKATLLQRVDELLQGIEKQLDDATSLVKHLEESLRLVLKELEELQEKIKSMEFMEEITLQVQLVRKKLAWAWVFDAKRKLDEKSKEIEKLKGRIPSCQQLIDEHRHMMEELNNRLAKKKCQIQSMVERTSEVRRKRDELQQSCSMAKKEKHELEDERDRKTRQIQTMVKRIESLEEQIHDFHEQLIKETQAEENEMGEKLRELEIEVNEAKDNFKRLKAEEDKILEKISAVEKEVYNILKKIEEVEGRNRDISNRIRDLEMHQQNKVTAFGGKQVISLLKIIEQRQNRFRCPPIGPIGAHVKLENGDKWSTAVEHAIGRLFNAFVVTDHKDSLTLRDCARAVQYKNLPIMIYDFSRPRLEIPPHKLPQTNHPTVLSVLRTDNHIVHNVLIDMGGAELQVLVEDYNIGKAVVFDQKIPNVKEVYTIDGTKMFQRHSAQTVLPPNRHLRTDRLCASFDNQITNLKRDGLLAKEEVQKTRGVKRNMDEELRDLRETVNSIKRKRTNVERSFRPKEFELQDLRKSLSAEAAPAPVSDVDELHQEIAKLRDEIQKKQTLVEKLQIKVDEAAFKVKDHDVSLNDLRESVLAEVQVLTTAEDELVQLEKDLHVAEARKKHYEQLMQSKVLQVIKDAETEYCKLENEQKDSSRKASIICAQNEAEDLGCKESNPEQLSAQLTKLTERLNRESRRFPESIEDLRMMFEKKQRKISRKQQIYNAFKGKLDVLEKASELRWSKFHRNADQLIKQLTWHFNMHLGKKGIKGEIKVNAEEQTLSIEVTMPQDASSSTVRDTRGLSGGERSFSTLCFALTLHDMTEAPFRAMDEFDVFMDAVSRKISLDALVDFALVKESQWIFITPHDISMVRDHQRIKKQQMAAPRG